MLAGEMMFPASLALSLLKGAVPCVLALILTRSVGHRWSPASRHTILLAAILAAGVTLAWPIVGPRWTWSNPVLDEVVAPFERSVERTMPDRVKAPDAGALTGTPALASAGATAWSWFAWVWAAGALLLLARLAHGHAHAWHLVRQARPLPGEIRRRLAATLPRAAGRMERLAIARARLSDRLSTPAIIGFIRPTLLLPATAVDWSADALRSATLHELAHVARYDALSLFMDGLVRAACWPNVLVHVLSRDATLAREEAADDAVIRAGVLPSAYVSQMVGIVSEMREERLVAGAAFATSRDSVVERLRRVLRPAPSRARAHAGYLWATLGSAVALSAPVASASRAGTPVGLSQQGARCEWDGGAHLNRTRDRADGGAEWTVAWSGAGCSVNWRSTGRSAAGASWAELVPRAAEDSILLTFARGGSQRSLVVTADPRPRYHESLDGVSMVTHDAPPWLHEFIVELDRHTAFAVSTRLPALARAGIDTFAAELEKMDGDHAAATYLTALIESSPPAADRLPALLRQVRARTENDAALGTLLESIALGYAPMGAAIRAEFTLAARSLRATSARDAALARLSED